MAPDQATNVRESHASQNAGVQVVTKSGRNLNAKRRCGKRKSLLQKVK